MSDINFIVTLTSKPDLYPDKILDIKNLRAMFMGGNHRILGLTDAKGAIENLYDSHKVELHLSEAAFATFAFNLMKLDTGTVPWTVESAVRIQNSSAFSATVI